MRLIIHKKKRSILIFLVLIIVLLITAVVIWHRFSITEEPIDKNDGTISIPGFESLELKADAKKQSIALSNPAENNCYFIISLYLEDGTLLWRSELIEPGENSKPLELEQPLEKGTYKARITYECFRMDEELSQLNGAELKLTLRVK